jgi:hypothetical protein
MNTNFSNVSNYYFLLSNENLGDLGFYVQGFTFPSITVSENKVPHPLSNLYFPGGEIEFGAIRCNILIDENLEIFNSIINELLKIKNPITGMSEVNFYTGKLIITSNKGNPISMIEFSNCFISSFSGFQLSNSNDSASTLTADIDIKFETLALLDL